MSTRACARDQRRAPSTAGSGHHAARDVRAPVRADGVVGRTGDAAARVRVLRRRCPRGADAARPPGVDRACALRADGPLPPDAAMRTAADRGRRTDLHPRPAARGRRTVDGPLAPDPRGAAARADPARPAAALPRVRVGAGQRVGLAPRPLCRGGRVGRRARRGRVRDGVPGARRLGARAPRAHGSGMGSERARRALRGVLLGVRAVPGSARRCPIGRRFSSAPG